MVAGVLQFKFLSPVSWHLKLFVVAVILVSAETLNSLKRQLPIELGPVNLTLCGYSLHCFSLHREKRLPLYWCSVVTQSGIILSLLFPERDLSS